MSLLIAILTVSIFCLHTTDKKLDEPLVVTINDEPENDELLVRTLDTNDNISQSTLLACISR
ncbi:MAG: hypothetical protein ACWA5P_12525 [bacterium]